MWCWFGVFVFGVLKMFGLEVIVFCKWEKYNIYIWWIYVCKFYLNFEKKSF